MSAELPAWGTWAADDTSALFMRPQATRDADPDTALAALPAAAEALRERAAAAGWSWLVSWGSDGTNPFVTMELRRQSGQLADVEIRGTWHTRATGTLRLFHIATRHHGYGLDPRGLHDTTVKRALALVDAVTDYCQENAA